MAELNILASGENTASQKRHLTIGLGSALGAFAEAEEVGGWIDNLSALSTEVLRERLVEILDRYQEQPHLIDPHLAGFLTRLLEAMLRIHGKKSATDKNKENDLTDVINEAHSAAFFAAQLIKVRGHKVVIRHFPHEVHHVEAVLELLESQDSTTSENWETHYVLLLWMSILVLIPFHLARFDATPNVSEAHKQSGDNGDRKAVDSSKGTSSGRTVMERILIICKRYLLVGNKSQQAASLLAAKFLTRPEIVKLGHLAEFLDWIAQKIKSGGTNEVGQTGALLALAAIYKHGKREDLLTHAPTILKILTESNLKENPSVQIRKLTIKIIQRLGLTFLKAKVASWRYQRGCRSLAMTLGGGTDPKLLKLDDRKLGNAREAEQDAEDDEDYDIPDEIEEVIEELLGGLRSSETIIRWSAAKGIGRITGRLPKELANEVVCSENDSLLQLFTLKESDGAWHGGCLAVAELARRGLLLPERLSEVVSLVERASVYDERRGNFSVGSHVRDAACYVCWSLARAFSPAILSPYLPTLASALITVSVFDREVNCRRAASAAFQENVGRQGADCLPNAIDILTTVDYHAVGSRPNCYTKLAIKLANYDRKLYGKPLINHLLTKKVGHWDFAVRELTAECLGQMAEHPFLHVDISNQVLPELLKNVEETRDLHTRHGSILAIGQVVHGISLYKAEEESKGIKLKSLEELLGGVDIVNRIKVIVSVLERKMALRGSGGEIIRSAVTTFIQNVSEAHFPAHKDKETLDLWKITLDDNLPSADPAVQEKAVSAVAAYVKEYCRDREACDAILKSYLANLDISELHRRGFSLAIGSLPEVALRGRLDQVLTALITRCRISASSNITSLSPCRDSSANSLTGDIEGNFGPGHERWAEGRRDVVKALSKIVKTLGIEEGHQGTDYICEANIVPLYECYLRCLDDYTIDRRGEVGAWVREAAMTGLAELTVTAAKMDAHNGIVSKNGHEKKDSSLLPEICVREMMPRLAQQAVEKIDRTRGHGAKIFATILYDQYARQSVPRSREILEIFSPILQHSSKGSSMDFETLMIQDNQKLEKDSGASADKTVEQNGDSNDSALTRKIDSYSWTVESATFPYFTSLLRFPEYRERVLLGLIVSVGGLTERLVIHASAALYTELEKWETFGGKPLNKSYGESGKQQYEIDLKTFCDTLLQIFDKNRRVDRITVPLFKFAERLLSSGRLDSILFDSNSKFAFDLFSLTKKEVCGGAGVVACSDPNKLMSAADVFCSLLQAEEPIARQKCLVQLCIFLCHKFPRIRKATASKLFEALLTYSNILTPQIKTTSDATVVQNEDEVDETLEAINGILSDTRWDTTQVEQLRPIRNKLCDLLGVPAPALLKKPVM